MTACFRTILVALSASLLATATVHAQATDFSLDTSSLNCKIVGLDGKPVRGAKLVAYHLSSARPYQCETSKKGECGLRDLPYGYHDIAILSDDGLFVADQVINIPPNTLFAATLTLHVTVDPSLTRAFPGIAEQPVGHAVVAERLRGRAFWKSPRGIAILIGVAGVVLLLLAGSGGDDSDDSTITEPEASPISQALDMPYPQPQN
jgi:hypothetical protein